MCTYVSDCQHVSALKEYKVVDKRSCLMYVHVCPASAHSYCTYTFTQYLHVHVQCHLIIYTGQSVSTGDAYISFGPPEIFLDSIMATR